MQLIQTLGEIDQKLEETASDIRLVSKSIMRYCNQSNVSFNLKNYKKELSSLENKSGIYIFYIVKKPNWISDFKEKWEKIPSDFEQRALLFDNEEIERITLYMGKSQNTCKQVMKLIEKSDSALRLLERAKANRKKKKQSLFEDEFQVRIIDLDPKYYYWVANDIEKNIRMYIKPIIGKQEPFVSYNN
ncbi:MAG: hypothetical protein WCY89_05990 [Flavobacteriaceae bacterium]